MLCKDRALRATVPELLAHPWLNQAVGDGAPMEAAKVSDPAAPPADGATADDTGAPAVNTQLSLQGSQQPSSYGIPSAVVGRLRNFSTMDAFAKESRKVSVTWRDVGVAGTECRKGRVWDGIIVCVQKRFQLLIGLKTCH